MRTTSASSRWPRPGRLTSLRSSPRSARSAARRRRVGRRVSHPARLASCAGPSRARLFSFLRSESGRLEPAPFRPGPPQVALEEARARADKAAGVIAQMAPRAEAAEVALQQERRKNVELLRSAQGKQPLSPLTLTFLSLPLRPPAHGSPSPVFSEARALAQRLEATLESTGDERSAKAEAALAQARAEAEQERGLRCAPRARRAPRAPSLPRVRSRGESELSER